MDTEKHESLILIGWFSVFGEVPAKIKDGVVHGAHSLPANVVARIRQRGVDDWLNEVAI